MILKILEAETQHFRRIDQKISYFLYKIMHENERGIVMQNTEKQEKVYYTRKDIEERYCVGTTTARKIMQSIRAFGRTVPLGTTSVAGALGYHKVLASELKRWEEHCGEGDFHENL